MKDANCATLDIRTCHATVSQGKPHAWRKLHMKRKKPEFSTFKEKLLGQYHCFSSKTSNFQREDLESHPGPPISSQLLLFHSGRPEGYGYQNFTEDHPPFHWLLMTARRKKTHFMQLHPHKQVRPAMSRHGTHLGKVEMGAFE